MNKKAVILLLETLLVYAATEKGSCPTSAECRCSFSEDVDYDALEADTASAELKTQIMATAAGALSSLVVAGTGLGIWKLVTMKKEIDRLDSRMSQATEPSGYASPTESRRGSSGTVSLLGTDDEISFSNSRTGSAADLNLIDDPDTGHRPHPSHNWGSDNPYPSFGGQPS